MTLEELLARLKAAGVEHGSRNKTVAEKTGYSAKSVGNILSGNAVLTDRFISMACTAFPLSDQPDSATHAGIDEDEEALLMIMRVLCSSLSARDKIDRIINMVECGP